MAEYLSIIAAFVAAGGAVATAIVSGWIFYKGRLPEILAYLERDDSGAAYNLVIKNIGNGVAYDIKVDPGSLPIGPDGAGLLYRFQSGIPMLAPGETRKTAVWFAGKSAGEGVYDVLVSFSKKQNGKAMKFTYPLEYHTLQHELITKTDLYLIRRSLQKIADK